MGIRLIAATCSARLLVSALLVGTLLGGSMSALANDGPHDNAIKARQGMYQLYRFNFGMLSEMAKERMPYDAAVASAAARNLNMVVNLDQSQLWPAGSDNATEGNAKNRALPAIWENLPDVLEKAEAMKSQSAALMAVAGNGLDELQGVVGDVGGACKACHDDYREKQR